MPLMTEYEFTLPNGYIDSEGVLHRKGTMRLATAADEILPMKDPRVQQNPAYLTILILSWVIIRLGTITELSPSMVEHFFAKDLAFLNDMYEKLNSLEDRSIETVCPQCGCKHEVPLNFTGEA